MPTISDLACELLRHQPAKLRGITVDTVQQKHLVTTTTIISSLTAAKNIGKPRGTYINFAADKHTPPRRLTRAIAKALKNQIADTNKILIIGLGNDQFIADSLGPQVLAQIRTGSNLLTFQPNVAGVTGINSVDAIKAITRLARPTTIIIIDSLVSATPERIGTNYQICTSGITPGSGLGRDNQKLDRQLLGVPVIALGIPVCTILPNQKQIYHVVPKDIDLLVANCANIIANALNTLAQ